jgi:hypothetical protein
MSITATDTVSRPLFRYRELEETATDEPAAQFGSAKPFPFLDLQRHRPSPASGCQADSRSQLPGVSAVSAADHRPEGADPGPLS